MHQHKTETEIALENGFSSSATFARAFKNYFGISAEEFRAKPRRENAKRYPSTPAVTLENSTPAEIESCLESLNIRILKKVAIITGVAQFVLLFAIEFLFPLKPEWKMTWKSFYRDLKYFFSGGLTIFPTNRAIGYAAISLSEKNVWILKQFPPVIGFIIVLLAYEFFLYWYHRLSHEPGGCVGGFLWRVHSIHRLPDKV